MITVEKLEKGTYFDDAFKISFRYDPTTVANASGNCYDEPLCGKQDTQRQELLL